MRKILLFLLFISACAFAVDLDTKIGQMIIVGFKGDNVKSRGFKQVQKQLKKGEISGVILFSRNIKSKNDLIQINNEFLKSSEIVPFISIDNEGGQIQRYDFIQTKSAKEIAKLSEKQTREEYQKMAKLEQELGFNLNFAPCVDLEINKNSIIAKKERSYGENSDTVSKYAEIFIQEHNKLNIINSIKHFPGHGSVSGDTHLGFVESTNTFKNNELLPYINLLNYDDKNMIMVSHVFNRNFDEKYPASLSKPTLKGFLRDKIGFDGVIVSDDFDMKAIKNNYSLEETLEKAINAGVNLLIFSGNISKNDKNEVKKIRKIIKNGIKTGKIDIEDINNSYERIINIKKLIEN